MFLLSLLLFFSPIGTLLLLALAVGAHTARYGAMSRALLGRGAAVGGIGAVLAALGFLLEPDILLPGLGTLAVILAAFMAAFALGVGVMLAMWFVSGVDAARYFGRAGVAAGMDWRVWLGHPFTRVVTATAGFGLILHGMRGVFSGEGRGAAAALLIGVVVVYWAALGRIPRWFRR